MGYIADWAASRPDHPAVVMDGSGTVVTYADLDAGSNRLARLLRDQGLDRGDHIALFAANHPGYFEVIWAGERSGLLYTPINSHLLADEVGYILADAEVRVLVVGPAQVAVAADAVRQAPGVERVLVLGADDGSPMPELPTGFEPYAAAVAPFDPTPIPDESLGAAMMYSSGTTGRPKGVRRQQLDLPLGDTHPFEVVMTGFYGATAADVYLSPAPLYHAAPLGFCVAMQRLGATVIVMERFDATAALSAIGRHRVTFSQWVPTMFVRMLKLPEAERSRFDLSSQRVVVHAAAPCPVEVKRRMIEWWGPIICEYYGGTELNGYTFSTATEWLERPGTVGRSVFGQIRILDDDGAELGPGEIGTVYFAGGGQFEYHNDPETTASTVAPDGQGTTLGDVGYLDEDGYLFLTDRKAHMIISGGVNVYPQEVEDVLVLHPAVLDVAVFGVPDEEMGEQVKAVVQPAPGVEAGPDLEAELIAFCRERLAAYKCPRSVDFLDELPRLDTGKLYKRALRARYLS